jgi:FeS assembly SUF system regulator
MCKPKIYNVIRITKLTDYGILLLTRMAGEYKPGRTHNARDLASNIHVPLPMVSKTLKALVRGGLLESQRGTHGGYFFSRDPEAITIMDIIGVLEGDIALTECVDESGSHCCIESSCNTRGHWHQISSVIQGALNGITLKDMTCETLACICGEHSEAVGACGCDTREVPIALGVDLSDPSLETNKALTD